MRDTVRAEIADDLEQVRYQHEQWKLAEAERGLDDSWAEYHQERFGDRACRCGHLLCGCLAAAAPVPVEQRPTADPTPHPGEWAADVYPCGEWEIDTDGLPVRRAASGLMVACVVTQGGAYRWNVLLKCGKWDDDPYDPVNTCDTIEEAKAAADARLRPAVETADEWKPDVEGMGHVYRADSIGRFYAGRVALEEDYDGRPWYAYVFDRPSSRIEYHATEAEARAWVEANAERPQ